MQRKHRLDYRPPNYWISEVELDFRLGEDQTVVEARLSCIRNEAAAPGAPLTLHGEELELLSVAINGQTLAEGAYSLEAEELVIPNVPSQFTLETRVRIHPGENTELSGLYLSGGNLCTQCEAEGFRRITYFPDRPDVMARYTVRLEANKERFPILLANGNRKETGELPGGSHYAIWEDPSKKPSYLFAIVAGDLACHRGEYRTQDGRDVALEIWVEAQNLDKCDHALQSLIRSMRWDEEAYGLAYDLDLYMIVAVNDFNFGAMENKGLNIFNSKYVLAKPETATDNDYEQIEGVIGHEYFHNWTGNRVTCRDWFQLTLKEGLTVFRDQQFTSDMTSEPVKRIADVAGLRAGQFAEDRGPMAHPIRPESYIAMDNFYTATVYRKGAEVIRMIHTLVGPEGFRKGMDLYFERHDGQAVTCDDFRGAMADANGRDLSQFERWYTQSGTPELRVEANHDPATSTLTLTLHQSVPPNENLAEQPAAAPFHLPIRMGLLDPSGRSLPLMLPGEDPDPTCIERVLELTEREQSFTFYAIKDRPVASLLRGFSAPVRLRMERPREDLAFLLAHDTDPFSRWDAGQTLARDLLLEATRQVQAGNRCELDPLFVSAMRKVLLDPGLDGSLKALALSTPGEVTLGQEMATVDPDALHAARKQTRQGLARALEEDLLATYRACHTGEPYRNDKASIARRRLQNTCLGYLAALETEETTALLTAQLEGANNMTDAQAALTLLASSNRDDARAAALQRFYTQWENEPLVIDKWFMAQALSSRPDATASVAALRQHEAFDLRNPNRVRALMAAFGRGNQVRFHDPSGAGYRLVADVVIELNRVNPQVGARLAGSFNAWRRFDTARQTLIRAELERVAATENLKKDIAEIALRALGRS